jgi:hypothetical protein
VLASALGDSLGLGAIFFVLFPAVVTGLIVFAVVTAMGERRANEEYKLRHRQRPPRR